MVLVVRDSGEGAVPGVAEQAHLFKIHNDDILEADTGQLSHLVEESERGGSGPVCEVEDGVHTAVEGGAGVSGGEAQPRVPDLLLLRPCAGVLSDVLRLRWRAAHGRGEHDVRPAQRQEVGPQPANGQLADTGQQLNRHHDDTPTL